MATWIFLNWTFFMTNVNPLSSKIVWCYNKWSGSFHLNFDSEALDIDYKAYKKSIASLILVN